MGSNWVHPAPHISLLLHRIPNFPLEIRIQLDNIYHSILSYHQTWQPYSPTPYINKSSPTYYPAAHHSLYTLSKPSPVCARHFLATPNTSSQPSCKQALTFIPRQHNIPHQIHSWLQSPALTSLHFRLRRPRPRQQAHRPQSRRLHTRRAG